MPSEEAQEVARQVQDDVTARLGPFFVADGREFVGYEAVETFGDGGIVAGESDEKHRFTFVRWRWHGRHLGEIPSRFGAAVVAAPTGNPVVVDGLTVVENREDRDFRARWFVDWLSVYAQLGVVVAGRPTRMAKVEVRSAFEVEPENA